MSDQNLVNVPVPKIAKKNCGANQSIKSDIAIWENEIRALI